MRKVRLFDPYVENLLFALKKGAQRENLVVSCPVRKIEISFQHVI
jgi:hypothetical protein